MLKQQLKAADSREEVRRLVNVSRGFDLASPKTLRQIDRIAAAKLARLPEDAPAEPRRRRKSFARLGAATLKAKALA
jgi:hypothetical protein